MYGNAITFPKHRCAVFYTLCRYSYVLASEIFGVLWYSNKHRNRQHIFEKLLLSTRHICD